MIITSGWPASMAVLIRKNMSVIQRNSTSASGTTVMRKSGLRCFAMSSRLIWRTRAIAFVSRKGMKSAGANVDLWDAFFIDRVSVDPSAGGGKVLIPEHEVGGGAGLKAAPAVEAEEARGIERAHGPDLLGREIEPAQEVRHAAVHGECAAGEEILGLVARGFARRHFYAKPPGCVVDPSGQAGADVGVCDQNDPGPGLGHDGGPDGGRVDVHSVSNKVHTGAWVGEDGFDRTNRANTRFGLGWRIEHVIEVGGVHGAGIDRKSTRLN